MNEQDRDQLVRTIWGEAAQEPPEGQAAIAHVVLNRLGSGKFGDSVSQVVRAPRQFQAWDFFPDKLKKLSQESPAYKAIGDIVDKAYAGDIPDPTGGATYYLNPQETLRMSGKLPKWAAGENVPIGNHTFYGSQEAPLAQVPVGAGLRETLAPYLKGGAAGVAQPNNLRELVSPYLRPVEKVASPETPKGALTPTPEDTTLGTIGKFAGTAGVKALASLGGMAGDVRELAKTGGKYLAEKLGLDGPQGQPTSPFTNLIPEAMPTSQEIEKPILAKTGQYVPESPQGRAGMAAAVAGLSSLPFGPIPAAIGALSGGTAQGVGEWTGEPLLGAGAGYLTGRLAGNALGGPRQALSAAQLPVAQAAERQGLQLTAPQMMHPNTIAATREQNQAGTRALNSLMGRPAEPTLGRNELISHKNSLGRNIDQIYRRTDVGYDAPLHADLNGVVRDLPADPTLARTVGGIVERIQGAAAQGLGNIAGTDFHDLVMHGGRLDKLAKTPGGMDSAIQLRRILNEAFARHATPQDLAQMERLRSHYAVAANVTPLVEKGAAGAIDFGALQTQAGKMKVTPRSPQNIQDYRAIADTYQTFLNAPRETGTLSNMVGNVLAHPNVRTKLAEGLLGAGAAGFGTGWNPAATMLGASIPIAHTAASEALKLYQNNPLFRRMLLSGQQPTLPMRAQLGAGLGAGQNLLMGQEQ